MHASPREVSARAGQLRLSVEDLAGERGGGLIFSAVGFVLDAGQALLIRGPNGAGKSTLLRVVAGLLPALSGSVRLEPATTAGRSVGAACHYLGHQNAMKTILTVDENLRFWQNFLGDPLATVDEALVQVGLAGIGHLPFGTLSAGQRRRVAIARLLVSRRPVWLLDEPTAALDAASEERLAAIMRGHRHQGGIILAATHLPLGLDDAQILTLAGPS